jgi:hypothetical protein
MGAYRGRLAPSPTGYLHRGHARTFWVAQQRATAAGGALVLRNDDLDRSRVRPEYVAAMLEDMRWLGPALERRPRCRRPARALHPKRMPGALSRGIRAAEGRRARLPMHLFAQKTFSPPRAPRMPARMSRSTQAPVAADPRMKLVTAAFQTGASACPTARR